MHPNEWVADNNRRKILEFIVWFQGDHEYSPSQKEIAEGTKLSVSTVRSHLQELAHHGFLEFGPGPRMIRVKRKGEEWIM